MLRAVGVPEYSTWGHGWKDMVDFSKKCLQSLEMVMLRVKDEVKGMEKWGLKP